MRIRVIDFESTGDAPPEDGLCEIGWCDLVCSRTDLLGTPLEWEVAEPRSKLAYPGVPIPPVTAAVHHIIDEDVCDAEPWRDVLRQVIDPALAGDDIIALAAHSAKFEKLWIGKTTALPILCTYKLALRAWPDAPLHSNMGLRYHRMPAGLIRAKGLPAHRAGPDAYVTAFHLRDILEDGARNQTLSIEQAIEISKKPALQVTCHIGKQRGMKWKDVDEGFLTWLLDKDFDEDVLFTAHHWLNKHQEDREAEYRERASP